MFFKKEPEERLKDWRNLKLSLQDLTLEEQLDKVNEFWHNVPMSSRVLDFYDKKTWMTPWEYMYEPQWCRNILSLMYYHTLKQIQNFSADLKLHLVIDANDRYLILVVDNKYVLNYKKEIKSDWDNIQNDIVTIETFVI